LLIFIKPGLNNPGFINFGVNVVRKTYSKIREILFVGLFFCVGVCIGSDNEYHISCSQSSGGQNTECTLAIIKPNAFRRSGEIFLRIVQSGFNIACMDVLKLEKQQAQVFYAEHRQKPFFDALVSFMTSGYIIVMVLEKSNAVSLWRNLLGSKTKKYFSQHELSRLSQNKKHSLSLRAIYGENTLENGLHGADFNKSAFREILFFFPNFFTQNKLIAKL